MSFSYHIDPEYNCVAIVHAGNPGADETLSSLIAVIDDPAHRPGMNVLRDARAIAIPADLGFGWFMNHSDAMTAANDRLGKCRLANLFSSAAGLGIGHQSEALFSKPPVVRRTFIEAREAKRWLNLPDGYRLDLVPNDWSSPESV